MTMMEEPDIRSWLQERKTVIGGTDSYGVCGAVDENGKPFFGKSRYAVWKDKTTPLDEEDTVETEAMRNGRILEPAVCAIYEDMTGHRTRKRRMLVRDKEHPFLGASPDYTVIPRVGRERRILEVKTSSRRDWWGPSGSGAAGVPIPYLFQVQHYLMITKADVADVAVMLQPSDVRVYEVEPDPDFIRVMRYREVKFWKDHVLTGIPPDQTQDDKLAAMPIDDGGSLVLKGFDLEGAEAMVSLHARIKELEKQYADLKDGYLAMLGKNRYLKRPDGTVIADALTIAPDGPTIDLKRVRAEHPELYDKLAKDFGKKRKPYRQFRIKSATKENGND